MHKAFISCDTLYHSFKPFNKHFTKMCIFAQKEKEKRKRRKKKKEKRSLLFGYNFNSAAVCKMFCSAAFANYLVQSKKKLDISHYGFGTNSHNTLRRSFQFKKYSHLWVCYKKSHKKTDITK